MIASPFPPSDFEAANNSADKKNDQAKMMMREQMIRGADEYIALIGPEEMARQKETLKVCIDAMNSVMGSSVRLSIPAIDAMLIAISLVPQRAGFDLAMRPAFKDLQFSFHAIKRLMQKEMQEKIKNQHPEL